MFALKKLKNIKICVKVNTENGWIQMFIKIVNIKS